MHSLPGLAQASATIQDFGLGVYLPFAAQISISLGIFNLLPIPALDGGRGIFILFEMLRGKPVDPEKEALVHFGGFAVLMALVLFISFHDVQNLIAGKGPF
jgi:regulator of sigma E protease